MCMLRSRSMHWAAASVSCRSRPRPAATASWSAGCASWIRPVHLHDSQAVAAQIAVQPGAVAAGALDAEPRGRIQLAHPSDQLAVAAGRGRDLQLTEAAAQCIERDRNMHILMGVDTDDDTRWIGGQTGHDLLLLLRRTWVITGRAGRTGL